MAKYMKRIKSGDLISMFHVVLKEIKKGNFDKSFEMLDEYGIGPQTLSPRKRNFLYILIEPIDTLNYDGENSINATVTIAEGMKICEFFKLFFTKGVEVNHQDKNGLTLLQWTSMHGCNNLVQFLLEQGADPNLTDEFLKTALYYATHSYSYNKRILDPLKQGGSLAIIEMLLRAGANPYHPYPSLEEMKTNKRYQWNLFLETRMNDNLFDDISKIPEISRKNEPIYRVFMETLKELGKLPQEN